MRLLVFICLLGTTTTALAQRWLAPPTFAEMRVQVRVEQANLCYPPAIMALYNDTVAAMTKSGAVPPDRLADFVARMYALLSGKRSVCGAYGVAAIQSAHKWLAGGPTDYASHLILPSEDEYAGYCLHRLRNAADPPLAPSVLAADALKHDDPLWVCLRAAHFIEMAQPGLPRATGQRVAA
jgi:hypothetical protein